MNLATRNAVLSDKEGHYSLAAKPGELISFSYIGYSTVQKVMPFGLETIEMNIELESISYSLAEFIYRGGLTKYQVDSIQRKQTYARTLVAPHATVMSPVSLLAEQFSSKSKQTFRFQRNFVTWEKEQFIDSRYTPELVSRLTGFKGDTLGHFMNTHVMPYDYARAATDLELKAWIREHYREYLKLEQYKNIPKINDSLILKP